MRWLCRARCRAQLPPGGRLGCQVRLLMQACCSCCAAAGSLETLLGYVVSSVVAHTRAHASHAGCRHPNILVPPSLSPSLIPACSRQAGGRCQRLQDAVRPAAAARGPGSLEASPYCSHWHARMHVHSCGARFEVLSGSPQRAAGCGAAGRLHPSPVGAASSPLMCLLPPLSFSEWMTVPAPRHPPLRRSARGSACWPCPRSGAWTQMQPQPHWPRPTTWSHASGCCAEARLGGRACI